jgi:hypothetical protein
LASDFTKQTKPKATQFSETDNVSEWLDELYFGNGSPKS